MSLLPDTYLGKRPWEKTININHINEYLLWYRSSVACGNPLYVDIFLIYEGRYAINYHKHATAYAPRCGVIRYGVIRYAEVTDLAVTVVV
jgi:hypothetical protein